MTVADPRLVRGVTMVLLSMLMFACLDATAKILARDFAVSQMLWIRYLMFCVFALWLARADLPRLARSRRPGLQAFRSVVLVGEMALFILALRHLPVADVHAIAGATPLLVMALAAPLLGERVVWRQWLAVGVGFAGVLVIVRPGFAEIGIGAVYALLGGVSWAFYQVMLRIVGRDDDSATTLLYSAFIGAAITSVLGPSEWRWPDEWAWGLFALVGIFGTAAHAAMTTALTLAPASALQPFTYALLVFAAIVGLIVFGQFPDFWTCLGAAIVVGAGLYAWSTGR
jgi:drug/metabolite transporter (DMT)-like permease